MTEAISNIDFRALPYKRAISTTCKDVPLLNDVSALYYIIYVNISTHRQARSSAAGGDTVHRSLGILVFNIPPFGVRNGAERGR